MIYSPIWWIGDWWPPDSSPDCVDLESCVGHNTCWLHVCECCLPLWWMSSWMNNEQYTMTTSMRMVEMITDNAADEMTEWAGIPTQTPDSDPTMARCLVLSIQSFPPERCDSTRSSELWLLLSMLMRWMMVECRSGPLHPETQTFPFAGDWLILFIVLPYDTRCDLKHLLNELLTQMRWDDWLLSADDWFSADLTLT